MKVFLISWFPCETFQFLNIFMILILIWNTKGGLCIICLFELRMLAAARAGPGCSQGHAFQAVSPRVAWEPQDLSYHSLPSMMRFSKKLKSETEPGHKQRRSTENLIEHVSQWAKSLPRRCLPPPLASWCAWQLPFYLWKWTSLFN